MNHKEFQRQLKLEREREQAKKAYHEKLATEFWTAVCKNDMGMVLWEELSDARKRSVRAGITAVLEQIDRDVDVAAALLK